MLFIPSVQAGNTIITDGNDTIIGNGSRDIIINTSELEAPEMSIDTQKDSINFILCHPFNTHISMDVRYCGAGASSTAVANHGYTKGKWYFEATLDVEKNQEHPNTWSTIGVLRNANNDGMYWAFWGGDNSVVGKAIDTWHGPLKPEDVNDHDIIGVAMDADAGKVYFHKNGKWLNGQTPPATSNNGNNDPLFAAISASAPEGGYPLDADVWYANLGYKPFMYDIPNGYKAYDQIMYKETLNSKKSKKPVESRQNFNLKSTNISNIQVPSNTPRQRSTPLDRACTRVEKRFAPNTSVYERVMNRIKKRFGSMCS